MFRAPRENARLPPSRRVRPDVGRPPSPPLAAAASKPTAPPSLAMATKTTPSRPLPTPKPKQTRLDFSKSTGRSSKPKAKPNASILSFFRKTDEPRNDEPGLFLDDRGKGSAVAQASLDDADDEVGWEDEQAFGRETAEETRFNENQGSVKKRKLGGESGSKACSPPPPDIAQHDITDESEESAPKRPVGPFFEDSESEEEDCVPEAASVYKGRTNEEDGRTWSSADGAQSPPSTNKEVCEDSYSETRQVPPLLKRETISYAATDGFADFEGIEDFEEFTEGEEYDERRWMQEQRRLETAEAGLEGDPDDLEDGNRTTLVSDAPICPICSASLEGVSDQDASVHVNSCLDGNPTPIPEVNEAPVKIEGAKRFRRPARPAKPGQANPFALGAADANSGSAFTKLMSGHAENAAWASAAAAEHAARGKPAYKRTCPFYKILPGFSICVDAFRYGAVQGCQAYFLSHFHSDHYIGLTASWNHGPIYCSRVTANLVRQQLRVDPKWVVDLEWEKETNVPGTDGVKVIMISANHCPGSSLFLFEKAIGKGKDPRVQRVLHCGDFRACRAHVDHPLLRPEVMDVVTGKTRQQKIDVCYLDTTYLNPKYSFPNQEEVIQACVDMCVSLNTDETDGWEQMKPDRARKGMAKFVRKESKQEERLSDGENSRGKLLVVVGTYSIGKERICLGIAKAMDSKIYAPPGKLRICAALEDPELDARLTRDPREAQIHMTPLFEIRADTLDDYLKDYRDTFAHAVGFRPSGWNYRPPNSRFTESPLVQTVLHSANWKNSYGMRDLVPQRGSTSRASCFGVPYSEHSSFRELTMFCCALRIDKIIPTVNVGSAKSREKMKGWCDKWAQEKKKNGLFKLEGEGW